MVATRCSIFSPHSAVSMLFSFVDIFRQIWYSICFIFLSYVIYYSIWAFVFGKKKILPCNYFNSSIKIRKGRSTSPRCSAYLPFYVRKWSKKKKLKVWGQCLVSFHLLHVLRLQAEENPGRYPNIMTEQFKKRNKIKAPAALICSWMQYPTAPANLEVLSSSVTNQHQHSVGWTHLLACIFTPVLKPLVITELQKDQRRCIC